jgi:hypothetical protein
MCCFTFIHKTSEIMAETKNERIKNTWRKTNKQSSTKTAADSHFGTDDVCATHLCRGLVRSKCTLKKVLLLQHKPCVWKRSQGFCIDRTQTFVLDNLKNTIINTNLCGISAFCVENSEIPHKFVSINEFFKFFNTKVCVLTTQNPRNRFRTQTFLECGKMANETLRENLRFPSDMKWTITCQNESLNVSR